MCEVVDAPVSVRRAEHEPWHPGRCAEILLDAPEGPQPIGYAGELHPRVCQAYGVPARTIALELELDVLLPYIEQLEQSPPLRTFPVATQDVALVVDAAIPAAEVEAALRAGAGDLLESVRLFDVYTGDQVGAGRRSLAYALRFRAAGPDPHRGGGLGRAGRGGGRGRPGHRGGAARLRTADGRLTASERPADCPRSETGISPILNILA